MTALFILAKNFVEHDSHSRRKIQRTHLRREHRQVEQSISIALAKLVRQAGALASKDKNDSLLRVERGIPERSCRSRGKEERFAQLRQFLLELRPTRPDFHV